MLQAQKQSYSRINENKVWNLEALLNYQQTHLLEDPPLVSTMITAT